MTIQKQLDVKFGSQPAAMSRQQSQIFNMVEQKKLEIR